MANTQTSSLVDRFNSALDEAQVFSVDSDIFPLDCDGDDASVIAEDTPDDKVVLSSPDCDYKFTAGAVRAARLSGKKGIVMPNGRMVVFYSSIEL